MHLAMLSRVQDNNQLLCTGTRMLIGLTHQCGIGQTREPQEDREKSEIIKCPPIGIETVFATPILNQCLIIGEGTE